MRRACCCLIAVLTVPAALFGQGPPTTDIFLAELKTDGATLALADVRNITHRDGYDNQPSFLADGSAILYTSIRENGQADSWRYTLADGIRWQMTDTPESEYSPTQMPDGRHFSVVRVEADSAQRLWQFPLAGGPPRLLLPDAAPVGYHVWLNENAVAMFILGDPITLQIAALGQKGAMTAAEKIGRCLARIPGSGAFSFVDKSASDGWTVARMDPDGRSKSGLIETLEGSEDYAWLPDQRLLMARGASLFVAGPDFSTGWHTFADARTGVPGPLTRLAVSPDGRWLAMVATVGDGE